MKLIEFQFPDWGFIERHHLEKEMREEEASSSRVRENFPINNSVILSEAPEEQTSEK